mmetsp:Transcript_1245/g.2732  ORF Transcript_1245/g.2732 Transcript_1245/m.2732 type:complete len:396 (+) Transcript_1245:46-1233(+)
MDAFVQKINACVQNSDYTSLQMVFAGGPSSWQSLGQGEQRSLSAHFIHTAVSSQTFLPQAMSNGAMMDVFLTALGHLPTTPVENGADNKLRQMIFDYKVNEDGDYSAAARVLSGMRMEDDSKSVCYFDPADKCNVFVKIAECFLAEDEISEADSAVNKAGQIVESITNPDKHLGLILRYKSTYARVLDNNRKFLQAAGRYHDLSDQTNSNLIPSDDLLRMLGNAATCAILSPSGPQRQRVLGHIFKDPRLNQLDSIPQFETHATILKKMFKFQILEKEELVKFEASLQEHQKARMGDGLTIMERGVVEHNMIAVSKIYKTIYTSELAVKLGVGTEKAEKIAANMIMECSLEGSIDQVDGLVEFHENETPNSSWDKGISDFCMNLNRVTETVQAKQ